MRSAFALRSQIEATLADRIPAALTPVPRTVRPVTPTGVGAVDELLQGGLPVGAVTEVVGAECSGRTSLALSFVAQVTQAEKVCAWVDVSDALSPESAAASGVDLARMLWVRCGVVRVGDAVQGGGRFALPKKYFVPKPVTKGLHGGGMGGHPRGEVKGMDAAVEGLLRPEAIAARCAEPQRVEWERVDNSPRLKPLFSGGSYDRGLKPATTPANKMNPWARIEQALRATDLLLQAGGFGAIVLDMGSLAREHASRIPLATWFRYRAAAERTQASVLLLTQHPCAKSSAGLVLRLESGGALTEKATVLTGFARRIEVARQRFAPLESEEKVVPIRKPPQRAGVATWRSGTTWAGGR